MILKQNILLGPFVDFQWAVCGRWRRRWSVGRREVPEVAGHAICWRIDEAGVHDHQRVRQRAEKTARNERDHREFRGKKLSCCLVTDNWRQYSKNIHFLLNWIELPQVPSARVDQSSLKTRVFEVANVAQVPSSDQEGSGGILLKFAGRTTAGKNFVLIAMKVCPNSLKASLTVNCEKIVVGSLLAKSIRQAIENWTW